MSSRDHGSRTHAAPRDRLNEHDVLLRFLIDRRDKVVSNEELLEGVWEYQPGVSSGTIDVHVAWLRQKLEEDPEYPRYIRTVRRVGYRFSP